MVGWGGSSPSWFGLPPYLQSPVGIMGHDYHMIPTGGWEVGRELSHGTYRGMGGGEGTITWYLQGMGGGAETHMVPTGGWEVGRELSHGTYRGMGGGKETHMVPTGGWEVGRELSHGTYRGWEVGRELSHSTYRGMGGGEGTITWYLQGNGR